MKKGYNIEYTIEKHPKDTLFVLVVADLPEVAISKLREKFRSEGKINITIEKISKAWKNILV